MLEVELNRGSNKATPVSKRKGNTKSQVQQRRKVKPKEEGKGKLVN